MKNYDFLMGAGINGNHYYLLVVENILLIHFDIFEIFVLISDKKIGV